jgi:lysophospholipase
MAAPFHAEVAEAPPGATAVWLRAEDGKRLRAVSWRGSGRGTALVFPGRTEYVEKYGRVVGRLHALGLSVAVIDWRGQGLSERHPTWPAFGQVEDFRAYQWDVAALLDHPEIAGAPRPLVLVGHSMGGAIGLRTLMEQPGIAGAIFSAPMWGIEIRPAARAMLGPVTAAALLLGLGPRAMPGSGGRGSLAFEANRLTSDRAAFDWAAGQVVAHPGLALGPPSVHWTRAAFREIAWLARQPSPDQPMLGFLGGAERVVSRMAVTARFAAAPDGLLVSCGDARHEIFLERAEIQSLVWARIAAFLDRVAPG